MARSLVLVSEAETDILEAYGWYEERRRGLGDEFLSCVDACLSGIARQPELHAVIFDQYRRALVRRFPYAVFYEATSETVIVYGVLHTARDPDKWRQRLQ
jgi:toxin ParE1/3/4